MQQDRHGPVRVIAETPFAAGAPGDFPPGDELAAPGLQEVAYFFFVGIHPAYHAELAPRVDGILSPSPSLDTS